jgi:hypothetical protein
MDVEKEKFLSHTNHLVVEFLDSKVRHQRISPSPDASQNATFGISPDKVFVSGSIGGFGVS